MSGHTPGPWVWDIYASGYVLVGSPPLHSSVRQTVKVSHDTPDGRLIAAAPELLAALQEIEAAADGHLCDSDLSDFDPDRLERAGHTARAAIASATGDA